MKSQSNWDNKLKEALQIYQQRQMALIPPDDQINVVPSKKFETNMQKLISRQRKPYFYLINTASKRAAVIITVIFIALTTTVFSVEALRKPVVEFFVTVFEKFSTVVFGSGEEQDIAKVSSNDDFYVPVFTYSGTSSEVDRVASAESPTSAKESSAWISSTSSERIVNSSHNSSSIETSHDISSISSPPESSHPNVSSTSPPISSLSSYSETELELEFPKTIEQLRLPVLPEGYVLDYEEETGISYYVEYVNDGNDFFSFEQYVITTTKITVDTENVSLINTEINGCNAIYYENKGYGNLIWTDNEYGYTITGISDQELLSKIAESVE